MPDNLKVIYGYDITDSKSKVLVLPCSTSGENYGEVITSPADIFPHADFTDEEHEAGSIQVVGGGKKRLVIGMFIDSSKSLKECLKKLGEYVKENKPKDVCFPFMTSVSHFSEIERWTKDHPKLKIRVVAPYHEVVYMTKEVKVISGGQSGVDKVAWEVAKSCKLQTGGSMPKNFLTEDGNKPIYKDVYGAIDDCEDYPERAAKNVEIGDVTIAFRCSSSSGTDKTIGFATNKKWKSIKISEEKVYTPETEYKPVIVVNDVSGEVVHSLVEFIREHKPKTINIAGTRLSKCSEEYLEGVRKVLEDTFTTAYRCKVERELIPFTDDVLESEDEEEEVTESTKDDVIVKPPSDDEEEEEVNLDETLSEVDDDWGREGEDLLDEEISNREIYNLLKTLERKIDIICNSGKVEVFKEVKKVEKTEVPKEVETPKEVKKAEVPKEVETPKEVTPVNSEGEEETAVADDTTEEENSTEEDFKPQPKSNWKVSLKDYTKENIPEEWEEFFDMQLEGGSIDEISEKLDEDISKGLTIYPPSDKIYEAFNLCKPSEIKVIILGQDPYHDEGQAMGLSFSVPEDKKIPSSLQNIFKELKADGFKPGLDGDLQLWAIQGVFLLNTALTVQAHTPDSHTKVWKSFTSSLLRYLNDECEHLVVVLWGKKAESYGELFDSVKHKIISSVHPSGLSANKGFFGSKPFSKVNNALERMGLDPIDWNLSE